jgi:tetratricopeptide (TPR) repeat protein
MGSVFLAEQREPVHRQVALKIVKPGLDHGHLLARFEQERQALALMDHPNIAKVYDGGATETGQPYFVMELVQGGLPITKVCERHHLRLRERLELFAAVCQAVQHAHSKGVIHRDLKPNNVLVGLYDGRPVPKVIDFGVAKAAGQKLTERTMHTAVGAVVGTLEYMSPEQAGLKPLDIDTRTDIYSLGVLLYELLTGTTPLGRDRLKEGTIIEVLRVICEEDPPRPSTRIRKDADGKANDDKKSSAGFLSFFVLGSSSLRELDWVVMKALEKDRDRRYETASAFAADVQRFLRDEPVQAHPPSAGYRFRKFARRHMTALAALALVAASLLVAVVVLAVSTVRVSREKERKGEALEQARASERRAQANLEMALNALDEISLQMSEARLLSDPRRRAEDKQLLKQALRFFEQFAAANSGEPAIRGQVGQAYRRAGLIDRLLGQNRRAAEAFDRAASIFRSLTDQFPAEPGYREQLGLVLHDQATLRRDLGETAAAVRDYFAAIGLFRKVLEYHPERRQCRQQLALAHAALAGLQAEDLNDLEAAARGYRQAVEGMIPLIVRSREAPEYQGNLGHIHGRLAAVLKKRDDSKSAERHFRQAVKLLNDAVAAPTQLRLLQSIRFRHSLGRNHHLYGDLLLDTGERAGAERHYRKGIEVLTAIHRDYPAMPGAIHGLAVCHGSLGDLLFEAGSVLESKETYRQALGFFEQHEAGNPDIPRNKNELAWRLATMPVPELRDPERAVRLAEQAINKAPRIPDFWNTLGVARYRSGAWKAAVAALEKSIKLSKAGDSCDRLFLAMAHWQLSQKEQARRRFREAAQRIRQRKPELNADVAELRRFHKEAAALLGLPDDPPRPDKGR